LVSQKKSESDFANEREILYKILFDMRNDITDLKKLNKELINEEVPSQPQKKTQLLIDKIYGESEDIDDKHTLEIISKGERQDFEPNPEMVSFDDAETIEETVSLQEKEVEMIKQSLDRNKGKRKLAAKELGISERTLYRKINQYNL
jgi:DNA-binding NtrC family response regulator